MQLDLKDKKLLYELDINSRQAVSQLAKKVGLSKDAIKYRMNKLIDNKVIKSFNAVIDTGKLGFIGFRIYLKFYNLSPQKEKEILNFFLKNKNLIWLVQVEGNWDLNSWLLYKSVEEMNLFWEKLLKKFNNYIEKREFGIYSNIQYFGRSYLIDKDKNNFSTTISSLSKKESLSNQELHILELLSKNSRMLIVDLAAKTNLTSKTVINKIRKLEKQKIIIGYRTEFDLEKLGYKYYKIHLRTFNINESKLQKLKEFIRMHPNIIFKDEVLGGYDIEFEIQVKNEDELRNLIEDLRSKFHSIIKDYEVLHYYREHRLRFFPN